MEFIDKTAKIDVEAMKCRLLQRKIIRQRFKFPMTSAQAIDLLTAAYMAEVEYRHRQFVHDDQTAENIESLAEFVTSEGSKFGIMFCGVCGNGKTTLMYAFQNVINFINDCRGFEDSNTGILIADAKDITKTAKDVEKFQTLKSQPMLAIEDMGREPAEVLNYGNVLNPVVDLIEYRYDNQLFTAITTNLTGEQIREKYGKRIADRFNEMLHVVIFKNNSYRK